MIGIAGRAWEVLVRRIDGFLMVFAIAIAGSA